MLYPVGQGATGTLNSTDDAARSDNLPARAIFPVDVARGSPAGRSRWRSSVEGGVGWGSDRSVGYLGMGDYYRIL